MAPNAMSGASPRIAGLLARRASPIVVKGKPLLNLALWVVAGLLAIALLVSTSKAFVPREKIASVGRAGEWVLDFSPGALRAIAALELLAATGLVLPAVLGVAPVL